MSEMGWAEPEAFVSTPLLGRVFCVDYVDEKEERIASVTRYVSEAEAVAVEVMMVRVVRDLVGEVDASFLAVGVVH
jgi:hypothetical protein